MGAARVSTINQHPPSVRFGYALAGTGREVIIYWSRDDDAFVSHISELPGCMADGKSGEGALANVKIIAQEWIETARELGRPVPEPRGHLLFA